MFARWRRGRFGESRRQIGVERRGAKLAHHRNSGMIQTQIRRNLASAGRSEVAAGQGWVLYVPRQYGQQENLRKPNKDVALPRISVFLRGYERLGERAGLALAIGMAGMLAHGASPPAIEDFASRARIESASILPDGG